MNPDENVDMPQGDWDREEAAETPVEPSRCIWCKIPKAEWDDGVRPILVGEDEVICSNCRQNLRQYKRSDSWMLLFREEYVGTLYEEVIDRAYQVLREGIEDIRGEPLERTRTVHMNASREEEMDDG